MTDTDVVNYVCFFELFQLLLCKNILIEISFETRQTLKCFRSVEFEKWIYPNSNFALNLFFDDFFEVEGSLIEVLMLFVINDRRYSFDKDSKVILTDIVLFQKVVEFVRVVLIPDYEDHRQNYKNKV